MDAFGLIVNSLPVAFSVIVLSIMIFIYIKDNIKREAGKEKIFNLLFNQFKHNLIDDKEDMILLINSISREYNSNYSLVSILEDYIVYISKNEYEDNNNLKNNYTLIKNIIASENEEKPFNNVPDDEKRILLSINENIKNSNLDSIRINIKELSSILYTKNKSYERASKINKWALPIAIISMIFTIIFGILGSRNIDYRKIEEINAKLIERTYSDE